MMSENNLKVKVTVKEQNLAQNDNLVFNQHTFISDIYECEKQKYILEEMRRSTMVKWGGPILSENLNFEHTSYYKKYCNDCKKKKPFPNKVSPPKTESIEFIGDYILEYTPITALGGVIAGIIFDIASNSWKAGLVVFIVAIIIGIVLGIYKYVNEKDKYNGYLKEVDSVKKQNLEIDKYNQGRYKYWKEQLIKDNDELRENFMKNERPIIAREKKEIELQLSAVYDTLEMLYNLRINGVLCLHPNYQGLVPISIIYGYFDTGRCTQLQGHEGAYNLYEDEKMKGMIINKLDIVSQQLGQLNNSMTYVVQAIQECNERLSDLESASDRMINSVNNMNNNVTSRLNGVSNQMIAIEENTANSAYYAEVGARMTTFNTVYNLLND